MDAWGRDTPWRQGKVLTKDAFEQLISKKARSDYDFAVVVSHDCDLAQTIDAEPNLEVILAKWLDTPDGNQTHSKNARRLHLPFSEGENTKHAELKATGKLSFKKKILFPYKPEILISLGHNELSILQRWLSARYRRAAFPDEFNTRMNGQNVDKKLGKLVKNTGDHIRAIYFDLDENNDKEKSQDENYEIQIYILYSEELENSFKIASETSKKIFTLFEKSFYSSQTSEWIGVELVACEPVSDEAMTIAHSLRLLKWNGDNISLQAEPQQTLVD